MIDKRPKIKRAEERSTKELNLLIELESNSIS